MFLQLHDLRYNNVQDRITLRRVIFFVWKIFPNVSTLDRKREREGKKEEEEEEEKKGGKRKRRKKIFRRKSRALLTAPEASRLSLRMKTDWFKGANSEELALLINTRRCALAGVFIFPPHDICPAMLNRSHGFVHGRESSLPIRRLETESIYEYSL